MRLKVCILAHEAVRTWTPLYIAAFRQRCDVRVIGGAIEPGWLGPEGWDAAPPPARPNDFADARADAAALLDRLPPGWSPDLFVVIQSRAPAFENLAALRRPVVYISVDTWHDWHELVYPRVCDFVFAAQRVFPSYLNEGGAPFAYWLPLACDPEVHRPVAADIGHDIVFVGTTKYVVNEERILRLVRLAGHFSVGRQEDVGPEEMCRVFCSGRLVFNSSVCQDVNMRVFEAMAAACPLLTNRDASANGLDELFEEDRHYIGYGDADLIEQARRYLDDPAACRRVASAAHALAIEKHTYLHRIDTLLETLRAAIPGLGRLDAPLRREGDALSAYLPFGAKIIVDIGMGLDRSKVGLRGLGATRVIGIAPDTERLGQRKGSYDEALLWPIEPGQLAGSDVLLWTSPGAYAGHLSVLLDFAHAALRAGGTLVLKQTPSEMQAAGLEPGFDPWQNWAYERGFHLLLFREPKEGSASFIVSLRKFTRTVNEMHTEIHTRWPGGRADKSHPPGGARRPE